MRRSLAKLVPARFRKDLVVIPAVRLSGPIGLVNPISGGMTLATVAGRLERAFAAPRAPAVAILINSPGGSPVQSRLIFERIRQLAEEKDKKVLVFIEDVGASGGYMIACAGDEIVADPSSIVGSIGVVSAGFGFVDLLDKLGIERRVHTAGENKAVLDPFRPEKPEDVEHLKALQLEIHETFIDLVRERRGSRLRHDEEGLFTGLFWTGRKALALGLVDALGDVRSFVKERFGAEAKLRLIQEPRGLFGRRLGGAGGAALGGSLPEQALGAIEARSLWARYGL
ncbi:S49 family peptidase [Prosthecomicrobium sp. N25]|uniref:S49 family peptidase n=1 Tax=Prosthecomicrobium sp. N25 TaxID=3129254 RepID=UPI0030781085